MSSVIGEYMTQSWRPFLQDESDGTLRIKAHGNMNVDARIVSSMKNFEQFGDIRAIDQLVNSASLPGAVGEAWAMADWHFGYGFPIGGVVATDLEFGEQGGAISPGGVGFDINCGVRALALDATLDDIPNLKKLGGRLAGRIPAGGSGKGGVDITTSNLQDILFSGAKAAAELGFGHDDDLKSIESNGMLKTEHAALSERAIERGLKSLGTLGSGNHFLEIQTVSNVVNNQCAEQWGLYENQLVVMIHSGSRGLGHQVCTDHVRNLEQQYRYIDGVWKHDEWGFELADRQLASAPFHSDEGQHYFDSMNAAANFAFANRSALAQRLRDVLHLEMGELGEARTLYDVAHNIAKIERHQIDGSDCTCCVHRKGATRAFPKNHVELDESFRTTGQPVLVPGNMEHGSWILSNQMEDKNRAFQSSCHGAGRAMARTKAKQTLNAGDIKSRLEAQGIRVHASTPNVLAEEAPEAYKNVDAVIAMTGEAMLAEPVVRLVPQLVVKG
jgi:tRNA-splicing ligase RtcB